TSTLSLQPSTNVFRGSSAERSHGPAAANVPLNDSIASPVSNVPTIDRAHSDQPAATTAPLVQNEQPQRQPSDIRLPSGANATADVGSQSPPSATETTPAHFGPQKTPLTPQHTLSSTGSGAYDAPSPHRT